MTIQEMKKILFTRPASQRQAVRRRRLWRAVIMRLAVVLGLILLVILVVSGAKSCSRHRALKAARKAAEAEARANSGDVSIGFTGCMILHSPLLDRYQIGEGEYDFSEPYQYIKEYYEKPDIMACEMEGSISDEANGYLGHPLFRYPAVFADNLADAGIDLQFLATNHIYDGMASGLQITLNTYEEKGLAYTGIRTGEDKKRWTIMQSGPVKVGYVNYTYGTPENFNAIRIAEEDAKLINMFSETSPEEFYREAAEQIAAMKLMGADFIVYAIHWGTEYMPEPSEDQKAIAQKLCDLGVDAVIGGHPHVEQPIDVLQSADGSHRMFCIYSIGNALSNQREGNVLDAHCEDGALLTLKLHKDSKNGISFKDIKLTPTWVYRGKRGGDSETEDEDESGAQEESDAQEESSVQSKGYDFAILPLDQIDKLEKTTGLKGIGENAQASYDRTMEILGEGLEKAKRELLKK